MIKGLKGYGRRYVLLSVGLLLLVAALAFSLLNVFTPSHRHTDEQRRSVLIRKIQSAYQVFVSMRGEKPTIDDLIGHGLLEEGDFIGFGKPSDYYITSEGACVFAPGDGKRHEEALSRPSRRNLRDRKGDITTSPTR